MGDVHLILGFIVPERVEVVVVRGGGGRHKVGKMQEVDYNDEGWRCHLAALLWDVPLVYVH